MRKIISASKVFDGEKMLDHAAIMFEDEKILEIIPLNSLSEGTQAQISYHKNCTLLPGLIDSHTHLVMPGTGVDMSKYAREPDELLFHVAATNLQKSLQAGVTSLLDLGSKSDVVFKLRQAVKNGYLTGPRLFLCGKALTPTGGHGSHWGGEVDGSDALRNEVRKLYKREADLIKIMATASSRLTGQVRTAYTDEELTEIITTAHELGLRVVAHATTTRAINILTERGIDVIAHCQFFGDDRDAQFDSEIAKKILKKGIFVNPTLQINRVLLSNKIMKDQDNVSREKSRRWNANYPEFERSTFEMYKMGIPLLAGSDCGWGWVQFGEFSSELDAMVSVGIKPIDALRSATSLNAEAYGLAGIGKLKAGYHADLLIVDGDPTVDIKDVNKVKEVWMNGEIQNKIGEDNDGKNK